MTKTKKSLPSSLVELVLVVASALGLALAIQAFVVKPYRIPSGSMLPTLHIGQRVLVNRIGTHFSNPSVGDIIVFHPPKDYGTCADPSQGENGVGQIEVLDQRVQVGGERVVVVADGRLARASEAATVVADHSIAVRE